jgi:hypothetical protein
MSRELIAAAAGLYLPSREIAHPGHELTQKIRESKVSREHDPLFARLLAQSAERHFPGFRPELVVSLPPKPGRDDRFRSVRRELAARLGAADRASALTLTRPVADYRRLGGARRLAAAAGSHLASESVRARSVLLIDDVVTSGAQAGDAIRALIAAGATEVRFACVARTIGSQRAPPRCIGIAALERSGWPLCRPGTYDPTVADRVVVEVVSVEPLPLGATGSRRAMVRWSDGTVGEALRWWADELLFCEGDLLGKTEAQLRSLHFGRDRDYLRSEPPLPLDQLPGLSSGRLRDDG